MQKPEFFVSITCGFITNSSSVVHHIPAEIANHPDVVAFMKSQGISNGFIGSNLWHRGECSSVLVSKEQKLKAQNQLRSETEFCTPPGLDTDHDGIILIYGDEYDSVASALMEVITRATNFHGYGSEYN